MRTRSGVSVTGSGRPQKRVARQRPRSSATTNDANDNDIMLVCDKCNKSIHPQADHITSHPCQHNFCTKCMISAHFKRGSRPFLCPITSCMGESSRTTHCQYYCNRVAEEVLTNPAVDPVYLKKDLPVEYLLHTHQNELSQDGSKEGVVLYCGRAKRTHDGKFGVKYVSVSYVHQPNNTGVYSSDILLEIGKYFSYLHNIILVPSKHHAQTHLPVLSPREYLEYRHSTIRPIDAALFSLSTGKFAPEFDLILEKDHTTFQNQYLATIAASDLLLRSVSNAPCFFQLMFGELLQRQNVSRQFLDICSAFQLAPSRKFYWKDWSKEVISALEKGLTIRPRDVVLLLFDNIGFKVLGKFASYDQWTLLQIIVIKEDDLKKAGFYNDDGQEQISRVPELDWIEEIENSPADELIDKVVGLRDEDYDILSECVLEDIFLALEYAPQLQDGEGSVGLKLPRMERIINYHTRQSIDNQSHHQNSDHIIERDNNI
jgi:hypothetical protein